MYPYIEGLFISGTIFIGMYTVRQKINSPNNISRKLISLLVREIKLDSRVQPDLVMLLHQLFIGYEIDKGKL
jgi:hypothetical protein